MISNIDFGQNNKNNKIMRGLYFIDKKKTKGI